MRNKFFKSILGIAAIIAIVLSASCSQANAAGQTQIAVTRGNIATSVAADGNVALINDRKLTFQTTGIVKQVNIKEGDRVKPGQMLAKLDTQPLELAVSSASLAVKSAELDLQTAKNSYEKMTYPYTFTTFALSVPDSLAAMAQAQRNLDEIQKKIANTVNPDDLVTLRQNLRDAQDSLTKAREKLSISTGQDPFTTGRIPVGSFWTLRDTQLAIDKAQLALDKANNDLQQANDELPKTIILAPFAGIVTQVNIKEGDSISQAESGSKVAFYLVDPDNLELKGTVDEIDVAKVALNQKADVTLDALPDKKINGEVNYISPVSKVEGGVVVYDIKIKLDNENNLPLKAGMTAKASIIDNEKTDVLIIPEKAIVRNNGSVTVKISTGEKVETRTVTTGLSDGTNTEITGGLAEGDLAVIDKKS